MNAPVGSKKQKITWFKYLEALNKLGIMISESGIKYSAIYGITRGGLIISVYLSHQLNIPMFAIEPGHLLTKEFEENKDKNILVVDDFYDTGKTLENCKTYDIAVLYKKNWSPNKPNLKYCIETHNSWLILPYEVK